MVGVSATVTDLLSRRAERGEQALHFRTAAEALAFATARIGDLERLAGSALLLNAEELDLPLSQARAVLAEVTRLHDCLDPQAVTDESR